MLKSLFSPRTSKREVVCTTCNNVCNPHEVNDGICVDCAVSEMIGYQPAECCESRDAQVIELNSIRGVGK